MPHHSESIATVLSAAADCVIDYGVVLHNPHDCGYCVKAAALVVCASAVDNHIYLVNAIGWIEMPSGVSSGQSAVSEIPEN